MAATMPIIAAQPLIRSAFSLNIVLLDVGVNGSVTVVTVDLVAYDRSLGVHESGHEDDGEEDCRRPDE